MTYDDEPTATPVLSAGPEFVRYTEPTDPPFKPTPPVGFVRPPWERDPLVWDGDQG